MTKFLKQSQAIDGGTMSEARNKKDDLSDITESLEKLLGTKLTPLTANDENTEIPAITEPGWHLSEEQIADFVEHGGEIGAITCAVYINHFLACTQCTKVLNSVLSKLS